MLGEKLSHLGLDRLGQQGARSVAQHLGERVGERPWLKQLDDVSVGHGVSLLCWRSGGVEHPHDTPPSPVTPSPTSGHSSWRRWKPGRLREERSRLSRSASVAKPIDYLLRRWDRFTPFLADGRICLTNNAAERALRGFALGRKSWLFAGSERGAARAAAMTTLVATAKLNDVDPLAWLADVLARIAGMPQSRLPELLPWEWKKLVRQAAAA